MPAFSGQQNRLLTTPPFGAGQKRYHLAEKNDTTPNTQRLRRQYQSYNNFYTEPGFEGEVKFLPSRFDVSRTRKSRSWAELIFPVTT
jgi:hypothetical protein